MPELPEVETVRRDLTKHILGKQIVDVVVLHPKTIRSSTAEFTNQLIGQKITGIDRIGKLLMMKLPKRRQLLLIHLKMTGQLIFRSQKILIAGGHSLSEPMSHLPNHHTRLVIRFADQSELFFNDLRIFGYLQIVPDEYLPTIKDRYGIEPLQPNFTLANFQQALTRRRTSLKAVLLNQTIVSGLGNIYVDEACFLAGIKPNRPANQLSKPEVKRLWSACTRVITLGIKHRGTTFNHFVDGLGQRGGFLRFLNVYGRSGEPCKICQTPIRKIRAVGRGTHFCARCQK